jgi:hypothetical protein
MNPLRLALSNGGGLLAMAAIIATMLITAYVMNPVKVADDQAEGVARSVGVIEGRCPHGWSHNAIADHVVSETCSKGNIVVTLYPPPLDKKANYGLDTMDPNGREIACRDIPGWPEDRCAAP